MPLTVPELLNELIETCKDGEQGFARAAKDSTEPELKMIFTQCAERCRVGATELQNEVRKLGVEPETHGSILGAVHRGWLDLKAALSGRDAGSILEECERGEDYARARYDEALRKGLPAHIRTIVQRQHEGVLANHDRVRRLRDKYQGR